MWLPPLPRRPVFSSSSRHSVCRNVAPDRATEASSSGVAAWRKSANDCWALGDADSASMPPTSMSSSDLTVGAGTASNCERPRYPQPGFCRCRADRKVFPDPHMRDDGHVNLLPASCPREFRDCSRWISASHVARSCSEIRCLPLPPDARVRNSQSCVAIRRCFARVIDTRDVSQVIQRRPHCSATYAVVPDPHVGSKTEIAGSVVIRSARSMTFGIRLLPHIACLRVETPSGIHPYVV